MKTSGSISGQMLDLTTCEKEPIHIPGAIQPHGVLFALDHDLRVTHVSDNCLDFFSVKAEDIIGNKFIDLFDAGCHGQIQQTLALSTFREVNPIAISTSRSGKHCRFDAVAHRNQNKLIVELERLTTEDVRVSSTRMAWSAISKLKRTKTLEELYKVATEEIKQIIGFDRVVIYQFDEAWNGEVVAESVSAGISSLMGLHFPASDIPAQARELYRLNTIRLIPTCTFMKSPIISDDPEPLDLSFSVLRNVSPIHIEYLQNMGATASLSVSLIKDDQLWGLLSCTHESGPMYVPYEPRLACELIGQLTASLIEAREGLKDFDYRIRLKSTSSVLIQYMTQEKDFIQGLFDRTPNLLDVTGAEGAAIYLDGSYSVIGSAPDDEEIEGLVSWLSTQSFEEIFCTENLPSIYTPARRFKSCGCGVLAVSLSRGQRNFILWFRPEVIQTVTWGGNPNKPIEVSGEGELRIHPRKSFEKWKETVEDRCLPWLAVERESALEFRHAIIDLVMQRNEELAKLNIELKRSNLELDSFAYAASHDLKEPLRGIHNYTHFALKELNSDGAKENIQERLGTVLKLTQRMEILINSLLHYSQVGRTELTFRDVDLNQVIADIELMMANRLTESNAKIVVPKKLPTIRCDQVRVGEVFSNLVSNGLKYNEKSEKIIEICFQKQAGEDVFIVKDNGIGIREKNFDSIFRIFKRLHKRDQYGGGNGTGLTIVKSVVDRHGGRIWLTSVIGEGTTFYFTLGKGSEA